MSSNIIIAIAINIGLLLLASWLFGAYLINKLAREKQSLQEQLAANEDGSFTAFIPSENPTEDYNEEPFLSDINISSPEVTDLQQQLTLLTQENQQQEQTITKLESEKSLLKGQSARIASLEKTERRMRDENKELTNDNERLKRTIAALATASNEQLETIKKLHAEIERAAALEQYQRDQINDLEARLNSEKDGTNDLEKVAAMEKELDQLQDTLKRTLIEKEFIEEHMVELDDSLEKAKATEEALERARKEIETLEQFFPEFQSQHTPPSKEEKETQPEAPENIEETIPETQVFTTDNEALNDIIEDNRLFGALQEFWTDLNTPPITLLSKEETHKPNTAEEWVYTTIGNKQYSILLTVDESLAETIAEAISKHANSQKRVNKMQLATTKLGKVIADTLAEELEEEFKVGAPEHISQEEANVLFNHSTTILEMLATSQNKPIYAAMLIRQ